MNLQKLALGILLVLPLAAQQNSSIIDQGRVGPSSTADGGIVPLRLARSGELNVSDAHARYQEAVVRGNVYTGTAIQATVATTNNSPLTANTGVPLVGIFNPANSGKNLVILRATVCNVSGTAAAQPLFVWNVISAPAGITAAGTNGVNNLSFTANSAARLFPNSAITGSLVATALRPIGGFTGAFATSGTAGGSACTTEETAGEIIVPQGAFAGIAVGNGAGTTWIVSASMTWEEVLL